MSIIVAAWMAVGLAVATVAIVALIRFISPRDAHEIDDRSVRDLGPVSQQWLNGHRTEAP